jgi:hypothetical protein
MLNYLQYLLSIYSVSGISNPANIKKYSNQKIKIQDIRNKKKRQPASCRFFINEYFY